VRVYLAGGVNNLTGKEITEWRTEATRLLKERDIDCLDPTRGRIKQDSRVITDSGADVNDNTMVVRAKHDIKNSDVLLVEMKNTNRPYVGTSMEILYAWQMDKPVVVWSDYDSCFLNYHATAIFPSLEECVDFIISEFAI